METVDVRERRRRIGSRHLLPALLWLAVAPIHALAGDAAPAFTAAPTQAAISADDVKARIRYLASEELAGRASTEPGGFAASAYVAAEFQRIGLKPLGDGGGWFQGFPIKIPKLGSGNALEATVGGAKTAFAVEKAWNPFLISPNASASGPFAFAGYGISAPEKSYDDYAGFDAKGKVLLVLRKQPPWGKSSTDHAPFLSKLGEAAKHGAAALLVVNDPGTTKGSPDVLWRWSSSMGFAPGSGEMPFAFVSQETALALLAPAGKDLVALQEACDAAAKGGKGAPPAFDVVGTSVRLAIEITSAAGNNARNVVGLLEGSDPKWKDEMVVLGAHHDHVGRGFFGSAGGSQAVGKIHFGADDNASGTAAILEIAEAMAAGAARPKRSVLFLSFSGEEMGLLGSQYYVEHPILPLANVVTMVNCDMVGRYREKEGLEVGCADTAKGLKEVVAAANASFGLHLEWTPGVDLSEASDHLPFFEKKVPILFFFTGYHDQYHTPADTWDLINFEGEAKVAGMCRETVIALADSAERSPFTPPPSRPRAILGIQPARSDVEGVAVGDLSPHGPAARAGIEVGDVITGIGTATVRGPGDLFRILSGRAPEDEVDVRVLRGTETKTFKVTLGSRSP